MKLWWFPRPDELDGARGLGFAPPSDQDVLPAGDGLVNVFDGTSADADLLYGDTPLYEAFSPLRSRSPRRDRSEIDQCDVT